MSAVNKIVAMTVQSIKTLRTRSPTPSHPKSKIQIWTIGEAQDLRLLQEVADLAHKPLLI
jgi:hypothetical protein